MIYNSKATVKRFLLQVTFLFIRIMNLTKQIIFK